MANSAKKSQQKAPKLIHIDLTGIVTDPDLLGTRTVISDAYLTLGNMFFRLGTVPVHEKGKQIYLDGKADVTLNELAEMNALVIRNQFAGKLYQDAINKYFNDKIKEYEKED
jgi:hypothetical protein